MGYWGDMPCSTGDLKYVDVEYGEEEQAVHVDDQGDEDDCQEKLRLSRADHMIAVR